MAKYPKKAQVKIKENLHAMKQGKLESGSGRTVTNPKQALSALVYPKSEKGVLRYLRIKNKIVFIPNEKWNLSGVKYKMISSYCILGNGGK